MKVPKKLVNELFSIQTRLQTGLTLLNSPEYAFTRRCKTATTTLHYSRVTGESLYEVDREIGSDLCQLSTALQQLESLIKSLNN